MEPISTLLAAYLLTVTSSINQNLTDVNSTAITTENIIYENVKVPFQYHSWHINNTSVCESYNEDMAVYAECTIKAKSLFTTLCNEIPATDQDNTKATKLKNMYCNASVNYEPTIALISRPKTLSNEEAINKECNLLILKTMDNQYPELLPEKEMICGMR